MTEEQGAKGLSIKIDGPSPKKCLIEYNGKPLEHVMAVQINRFTARDLITVTLEIIPSSVFIEGIPPENIHVNYLSFYETLKKSIKFWISWKFMKIKKILRLKT